MHQIKTEAGILLIVSLPGDMTNYHYRSASNELITVSGKKVNEIIVLPEGKWQILARLNDLTDDYWMFICKSDRHDNMFVDFTEDSTRYAYLLKSIEASISSFRQLINPDTNPLILKFVAGSH